mgnify:CR=1 FL=1
MARCPECAGKMEWESALKMMVCQSCGLSLNRHELDSYWKEIKQQNINEADEYQDKKRRKKDWLDWYSKSKDDKKDY